jgi:hypothetical protein
VANFFGKPRCHKVAASTTPTYRHGRQENNPSKFSQFWGLRALLPWLKALEAKSAGHRAGKGQFESDTKPLPADLIETYTKVSFAKLTTARRRSRRPICSMTVCCRCSRSTMSSSCACLTDRGSEFYGNAERHEYELYRCISRSRTSITRRFHGTALNEFYRVAFRKRYIVQSTSCRPSQLPRCCCRPRNVRTHAVGNPALALATARLRGRLEMPEHRAAERPADEKSTA